METLKYKVISSDEQYFDYCNKLEELCFGSTQNEEIEDEIELLTLLIEKYDEEHTTFVQIDPVEILKSFMEDHNLKAKDIAELLGISKGLISNILNYKKGLSKESIRILAARFKVNQKAFNRPYLLKGLLPEGDKETKLVTSKYKMAS